MANDTFRYINIPELLKHVVADLSARAHLHWAGVWLFDIGEDKFVLRQVSDDKPGCVKPVFEIPSQSTLRGDCGLIQSLSRDHALVVPDDVALSESLKALGLEAAFPIFVEQKLKGFIGFGPKQDHTKLHQTDRDGLTDLGQKAGRAIGQAYVIYEQSMLQSKIIHDSLNSVHALGMVLIMLDNQMLGPISDAQKKQLGVAMHQRQLIEDRLTELRKMERLVMLQMPGEERLDPGTP